jgi:transcriptional regulator
MYGRPITLLDADGVANAIARYDRLAIVMTAGASGLRATHMPLIYTPPIRAGDPVRLVGHMARANDHWKDAEAGAIDTMVIMPGAETYISPSWYETKKQNTRVVPTWDYETIHVHGTLTLFTDEARLHANVADMSARHEAGRPEPWTITDAPPEFVARLVTAIVGVEITITRAEAKRKLSQDKPAEDRAGVLAALSASDDLRDREVAAAMREI